MQLYFQTHHAKLDQPDLITLHAEFLSRTVIGPAQVTITDLKLGRQFSTVRAQLFQGPEGTTPALCLETTITQGNMKSEAARGGVNLPTRLVVAKSDIPKRDTCVERKDPPLLFVRRTAFAKAIFMLPHDTNELGASATLGPSIREQWIRWRNDTGGPNGEGFSISSLPFLADTFIPLPEAYGLTGNWFPTMCLGIEVKKAPPTEKGWEWLFMRIEMRVVKYGRNDIDVVIMDEEGEIVALSRHTALIVSFERNSKIKGAKI